MTKETTNGTLYARICSVTGRGMWEGYVIETAYGEKYAIDLESAEKIAKDYGYQDWAECYDEGGGYWTEWYEGEEEYVERHGMIYELNPNQ
jgi:hypothetical protein